LSPGSETLFAFLQIEDSPTTSHCAQAEANDSSSSVAFSSLGEENHASDLPEAVKPHAVTKAKIYRLPEDIEDGLDDASSDVQSDISDMSKEDLLQLHSEIAEQRNSYQRKCVQVGRLKLNEIKHEH